MIIHIFFKKLLGKYLAEGLESEDNTYEDLVYMELGGFYGEESIYEAVADCCVEAGEENVESEIFLNRERFHFFFFFFENFYYNIYNNFFFFFRNFFFNF